MTPRLTTCLVAACLCLSSAASFAQPLEPISDEAEPDITIRQKGDTRYEEYRLHGQLYMIKVTPRIGKAYYLVARDRAGRFERYSDLDKGFAIPQWVIVSW